MIVSISVSALIANTSVDAPVSVAPLSTSSRIYTQWLPLLAVLAVIFAYAAFLYRHALNIPFADDILDVLAVLSGLLKSGGFSESLDLLFAQHNDHRTLSSRLLYYLAWQLEGEVNFRTLTFLANLALLLLMVLWYLVVREHPARWLLLLPVALVLFQLRAYGITLWSMAAFAYFYVYLYGFACLFFLRGTSYYSFALALVFALLATFTLASGQMVWLVGLLGLARQTFILKRASGVKLALWFGATLFAMWLWRQGLETPNSMSHVLGLMFDTPLHHASYYLALLGSAVSEESVVMSAGAGALMLTVLVASMARQLRTGDITLELFGLYIAVSVFAMVLGRAPYSEIEYALSSRYSFPSIAMLANTVLILGYRLPARSAVPMLVVTALALIYCITSYQIYLVALQPHMERRVDNFNRKNYWVYGKPKKETNPIVREAIALDIYSPPRRPYPQPAIAPATREKRTGGQKEKRP